MLERIPGLPLVEHVAPRRRRSRRWLVPVAFLAGLAAGAALDTFYPVWSLYLYLHDLIVLCHDCM